MTAIEKAAQRFIDILTEQIGYQEKSSASSLQDKATNAGSGNYTKYAEYFDNLWNQGIKWYNTRKQGGEWCDMFYDWGHCQAWGYDMARKVVYQPLESCGAGCKFSADYYRANGAWIDRSGTPKVGDQIFFGKKGDEIHTGAIKKVTADRVYTIEGNVSNMALEREYSRADSNIAGYGRPNYALVAAMFEEPVSPSTPISDDPETPVLTATEIQRMIDASLDKALGPYIETIRDVPDEAVRDIAKTLLDMEAVDGGTTYAVNPDDIRLPYNILRAVVVAVRYADKVVYRLLNAIKSAEGGD